MGKPLLSSIGEQEIGLTFPLVCIFPMLSSFCLLCAYVLCKLAVALGAVLVHPSLPGAEMVFSSELYLVSTCHQMCGHSDSFLPTLQVSLSSTLCAETWG